ncbi:MAG: hypothetical protein EA342_13715 [Leptolyngbya sp. LCM1.Bin17]|nr:MAG: hypothetical protein EA342_13715 [Leptolyngbya sp. LCM1.Bin17]
MYNLTSQRWTTEQFVQHSNQLAQGYGLGFATGPRSQGDRWTAQRHIQASALKAYAYGGF